MFYNSGKALKVLAYLNLFLGTIVSFCVAFLSGFGSAVKSQNTGFSILSAVVLFVGLIIAVIIFSLLIYAFGQLVDNSDKIVKHLENAKTKDEAEDEDDDAWEATPEKIYSNRHFS